jgi:hypothetical protein
MFRTRPGLAACGLLLVALTACSSGSKSASSSSTAPAPTTTLRVDTSFTGQGSANFCNLAKSYNDQSKNVGSATTPAELRTVVRDGQAAISQAVSAAPAEIKGDVQTIAAGFGDIADAFDKAGYDATKVSPNSLQKLQTPEFQTATIRFQAYLRNVCKLPA